MRNVKVPFALLFASLLTLTISSAQKIKLVNSGEVIKQAVTLYDSGRFEDAIALFKTIPKRDTNYVYMLSELALTYDANRNYKEAIETCEEGLRYPSEHRAHLFRTLGNAWDGEGDLGKAVEVFEKALKEFPYDASLHYNLAVTYYNHKQYEKAEEWFFKTLMINPYHSGSHLNIGRLSAFQGKKVRAMMAFGMYLSINNNDNERLVFLERFVNNELKDEGTFPFHGKNSFEKLDQLIRAKVVTDKNFKPRVPINAMLVRQYQFLLEQLSLAEENSDDPWIKLYLPVYNSIQQNDMLEPFLYHILTSTNNEDVRKWKKKNEKKLNQFYDLVNNQLQVHRKEKILPAEAGFKNPVPCWYDKDNKLEAIGHKNAKGDPVDHWIYFAGNGVRIAEGNFDHAGKKINTWHYFASNGMPKSVENYATGEMTIYNAYGEPRSHYFLKDNEVEGQAEVFHRCGQLKEKLGYSRGKRSGAGKGFYLNGQVEVEYNYKEDKLDGPYKVFYEDGKLMKQFVYRNDLVEGDFEEYHGNGTVSLKGSYKQGKATGRWEYYYINGQLERAGNYTNDIPTGEWIYYDVHGKLAEKRTFDTDGMRHGDDIMYHDGILYYINHYDHGLLIGMTYYNKSGKEIFKSGSPNGTFSAKGYHPSGQLQFEGSYKKGKADGEWKHYFREGQLERKYTCLRDSVHGEMVEYFKSGDVKLKRNYRNGTLHGYSTEFYIQGKVKEEGWFQEGKRQQQWLSYYADGSVETDAFYLNDELTGEYYDYAPDGKLYSTYKYRDGRIMELEHLDDKGKVFLHRKLSGDKEEVSKKYTNGNNHTRYEFTCGTYSGDILKHLPDGKLYLRNSIVNGKRHGRYQTYYINGQLNMEGNYIHGNEHGQWTWHYDNGKVYCNGFYLNGERDSVWTYYGMDGIKTSIARYKNNERNGVTQIYNPEGILVAEKLYEMGDLLAYRTQMEDGEFCAWKNFTGDETLTAYFPNGNKAYEETFVNGLLEGANSMYYQNGKVYYQYHYKKGNDEGPFVMYYPNGKVREKGTYKSDELDGPNEFYNADGSLRQVEQYKMGVRNGKAKLYTGSKVKEINFWAGLIVE